MGLGKGTVFYVPAGWNVEVIPTTPAATLDCELTLRTEAMCLENV